MAAPIWLTQSGSLGIIPEQEYYQFALDAYDPDGDDISFSVVSGRLPIGLQLRNNGEIMGMPVAGQVLGVPSAVTFVDTSTFTIRATSTTSQVTDRTFSLTIGGLGNLNIVPDDPNLGTYLDGTYVDIQLDAQVPNQLFTATFSLYSGELPPGVTLTSEGKLSGWIAPTPSPQIGDDTGFDGSPWDEYPWDFFGINISKYFEFVIEATDGLRVDRQPYYMYVEARPTADWTIISVDDSEPEITADDTLFYNPILLNPEGSIGNVRINTNYAYKFEAIDYDGSTMTYNLIGGSLPTGLALDANTGWVSGLITVASNISGVYDFSINVTKTVSNVTYSSLDQNYFLTVLGEIEDTVIWITPSDLGTIYNGAISEFAVSGYTESQRQLFYRLTDYGSLPIGLELLPDGTISGRVSFESFQLDGTSTTIDDNLTSFDLTYTFEVEAYDDDQYVSSTKTFTITVDRRDYKPYENLYIQALPSRAQRSYYDTILTNTDLFPENYIYRPDDPWFGVNYDRRVLFLSGLNSVEVAAYIDAMTLNHYWKTLNFGEIKTARALNEFFEVMYEVVYIELVDSGVNAEGDSPPLEVELPTNSRNITSIYPNSFPNMATRMIDGVGYQNKSILPSWMTSKQVDGTVLGFVRVLPLCYTKPGYASEVQFRLQQSTAQFNLVDFTIDRYEWDKILSNNFSKAPYTGQGTITTSNVSNLVVGTNTNFFYQDGLVPGKTIFVNNVSIGNIDFVNNANALTLTTNAASTNSNVAYTYTSNIFLINNYTIGSGTITANINSNLVTGISQNITCSGTITGNTQSTTITGNGTAFDTELNIGKPLLYASQSLGLIIRILGPNTLILSDPLTANLTNVSYGTTGLSSKFTRELHVGDTLRVVVANTNVIVGTVADISSNIQLVLESNAAVNISNVAYSFTTTDPYTIPGEGNQYLKFPQMGIVE